jgi:hypothetical protein
MGRKGFENSGLDGEEVEFAVAAHIDQPACLQFLDVMGERCRGNCKRLTCVATAKWAGGFGDTLKQLEALGIGEGFEEGGALGAGEAGGCYFAYWS